MPDSLTLSREWMKLLGKLPTETARWNVLAAAANYAFDGKEPRGLSDEEKAVFRTMKAKICHRRRTLKYLAKRQILTHASNFDATSSKTSNLDAPSNLDASRTINNPYQDKDLNLKTHTKGAPAREEVQKYSEEVGRPDEADRFFDYYESNGWTCSNGQPLVDWMAAFRYWINGKGKRTKKPEKLKRDYTGL